MGFNGISQINLEKIWEKMWKEFEVRKCQANLDLFSNGFANISWRWQELN